jgi:predicted nucleic acid-binding protein
MPSTLVDSGPLIALFDGTDRHHVRVKSFLKGFRGSLVTTWPVLTEVCHFSDFSTDCQLDFLRGVQRGAITIADLDCAALDRMIGLVEKYRDRPMNLADASLVVVAHTTDVRHVVSIDSDFDIYRLPDGGKLRNLLRR